MQPLITNPTWIFLVMLLVILLAPILFRRLRIPHIIGLILAGALLGEHGLGVLARDTSFELFGQVGIYYIMFLAGLEMDMGSFRRHGAKGAVFGLFTFAIPFFLGFFAARYLLQLSVPSSLLVSCILASHTLVTYPVIGRYGLSKQPSVTYAIIATAIASFAALLMLAIVVQKEHGGRDGWYWLRFGVGIVLYIVAVAYSFPKIGRWFLRRNEDAVTQYIFVLTMVFISAVLAATVGLEGLLGAFIAGLVLNRIIPHGGPLMSRIEFVGNALFVPWFLIGVGMIIDWQILVSDARTLMFCGVMLAVATFGKWLAALLMQRVYGLQRADRFLMFGLTNSHAAGALAIVIIGTQPGVELMNVEVLNATVVLILFSCIISSFATEKGARQMALRTTELDRNRGSYHGKCLTAYAYPRMVDVLTQLSIMIRNPRIPDSLMGLAVSMDDDPDDLLRAQGVSNLEKAREIAAAADVNMSVMSRISSNVASAIVHTMREVDAGEIIMGMHETEDGKLSGKLGVTAQSVLNTSHREVLLVHLQMPLGTVRRIIVAVPPKAEYEVGFYKWLEHLCRIAEQTGQPIIFHTQGDTGYYIKEYLTTQHPSVQHGVQAENGFGNLIMRLPKEVNEDHLLIIVTARAGFISYTPALNTLPHFIAQHFSHTNVILLYPDQYGDPQESLSVFAPNGQSVTQRQLLFEEWLGKLRN
ncbi:MAG: cation:proton antiporter [Bacteroidaceae bacterium]|nr:cation:proton antiporter [Bacteroidaceae bacterium]